MDVGEAKAAIAALLKRYEKFRNDPTLLSNEKQACQSLIVPLIRTVLGWDVDDPSEFKVEEQLIGKRIDYVVCSDGISQFIVEAKAPTREIIKDAAAYQQALDYGHGKNHPFAILTNFRQFIVLDCFRKTRHPTEAEIARIDLTAANDTDIELLLLFERGYWLSSGTQNRLYALQHTKDRRATVDAELLEDMKTWREQLLRSLRKHETRIEWDDPQKVDQAEEEVQRMIDRLVFIAFCEDKGLKEPRLWELLEAKNGKFSMSPGWLWGKVRELYTQYDKDYDSSLFKKSRCDEFNLDDAAILTVLQDLRAPPGRPAYNFASIEVDILGRVYENFIGHIQTGKKRFTEKEDKGKRKKEGIYYTPKYIVDYIVNNTVRVAARGKSFEDILKLKIVDPACGSGSFLLGAFGVLCEEAARSLGKKKGEDLSEDEKKRIMTSCIHGVDLDRRAVQIAELSLALRLAGRSRLPELSHNIRHGNSLIDDDSVAGFNAFKWAEEFPDVFKQGGFDVVVGNPPYIFGEHISQEEKTHFQKEYTTARNQYDTYWLFIEKSLKIIRKNGIFGFIIPDALLARDETARLRTHLIEHGIYCIAHVGKVFADAAVSAVIIIASPNKPSDEIEILNEKLETINRIKIADILNDTNTRFVIEMNRQDHEIIRKMLVHPALKTIIGEFSRGEETGKVHLTKNDGKLTPIVAGVDIKPYRLEPPSRQIEKKHIQKPDELYRGIKIIIPKTGTRVIAAVDHNNHYTLQSVYNLKLKNENQIMPVLGILNSRIIQFFINKTITAYKKVFPQLTQSQISAIPIPPIRNIEQIRDYVERIIEIHGKFHCEEMIPEEIHKKISLLKSRIDDLVYDLYGLTAEERRIVEESTK